MSHSFEHFLLDQQGELVDGIDEFSISSAALAADHPHRDHDQLVDDESATPSNRQRPDPRIHDPLQTGIRRLGHRADQLHRSKVHFGESVVRLEIPDLRDCVQRVNYGRIIGPERRFVSHEIQLFGILESGPAILPTCSTHAPKARNRSSPRRLDSSRWQRTASLCT